MMGRVLRVLCSEYCIPSTPSTPSLEAMVIELVAFWDMCCQAVDEFEVNFKRIQNQGFLLFLLMWITLGACWDNLVILSVGQLLDNFGSDLYQFRNEAEMYDNQ